MNKEEFIYLSLNPNQMAKEDVISLESILEEYPYFQTAQVLHLKGLKLQKSFKYNNTLKKVAAYTTNRTVLFDFITSDVFDFDKSSKEETNLINDIEVVDSKLIEHLTASIATQEKENISFVEDIIKKSEDDKLTSQNNNISEREEELELGKPLNFSKSDEFSFNEWLNLTSKEPIKRVKEVKSEKKIKNIQGSKLSKQLNLIDNFIEKKPKIKPDKTQKIKDVAIESVTENTALMTETLARVYLEQKKYNKAITAFKILSLKYPEKSSFFADRIKAIKFIQKNKS